MNTQRGPWVVSAVETWNARWILREPPTLLEAKGGAPLRVIWTARLERGVADCGKRGLVKSVCAKRPPTLCVIWTVRCDLPPVFIQS